MKRSVAAFALISALLGALPALAAPVRVPGTSVSLEPPAGFVSAESYPGFQNPEKQATILVTQMPAPAAEIRKAMTKDLLATRGITLLSSSEEKVGGRDALLVHVAQSAGGVDYLKWILLWGDAEETVMVTGTFPKSAGEELGAAIRSAVLTATPSAVEPSGPFEGLLFRIEPAGKLKIANRVSNMLLLTEDGRQGTLGPGEPIYVIGSSFGAGGVGNLKAFSEARARKTEQITDLQNLTGREITLGGLEAWEILADAKDVKSGIAIRLYQVIAPDAGGYFIAQGLVGEGRAAEMLPEFRRVTESFRKTDD
jgi:hypothetical protein